MCLRAAFGPVGPSCPVNPQWLGDVHDSSVDWYSVRCVFRDRDSARLVEERITLWRVGSFPEAIELAEHEAEGYASDLNLRYLGLAQAFKLSQEPGDGAEMFSLMRETDRPDEDYLTTFFNTGTERQRHPD